MKKITIETIRKLKGAPSPFASITAYDFTSAKLIDDANIPLILVGDSAAMVVYGHDTTIPVSMDEMIFLVASVSRGANKALVVADMPYMSFHSTPKETLHNASRFIQEGKADGVKLEGGSKRKNMIEALVNAEIPVMGHLGLTPQSKNVMGGYKIQGRTLELATQLLEDAITLESLGCFAIVLEGVPSIVAETVTENISIPTIGIGAGVKVDGQVLVYHDLIGMKSKEYIDAKFVKRYSNQYENVVDSMKSFKNDIEKQTFPTENHSYDAGELTENNIKEWKKEVKKILS